MARARGAARAGDAEVRAALEQVRAGCDVAARRALDPVHFVHRYTSLEDREIVGLIASSLAFGNVKAFSAKIEIVLDILGPSPAVAASDARAVTKRLARFQHRFCSGGDLAALIVGARRVQLQHAGLGAFLARALATRDGDLVAALVDLTGAIRAAGGLDRRTTHGARHILPRPDAGSANKRMMLFLRWMARPADGVDLGLWPIGAERLVMPLDVHIHKLSRNIGFTDRPSASWRTALEVTRALARLDPSDPTQYDFALCHLGMLRRCPSRRDPALCEGCGVRPICRHWR